jgi:hypothetical protein
MSGKKLCYDPNTSDEHSDGSSSDIYALESDDEEDTRSTDSEGTVDRYNLRINY